MPSQTLSLLLYFIRDLFEKFKVVIHILIEFFFFHIVYIETCLWNNIYNLTVPKLTDFLTAFWINQFPDLLERNQPCFDRGNPLIGPVLNVRVTSVPPWPPTSTLIFQRRAQETPLLSCNRCGDKNGLPPSPPESWMSYELQPEVTRSCHTTFSDSALTRLDSASSVELTSSDISGHDIFLTYFLKVP